MLGKKVKNKKNLIVIGANCFGIKEQKKKTIPNIIYKLCVCVCVCVLKATAEQIRLAQMIFDKNDADFEDKVNQVKKPVNLWQTLQIGDMFFRFTHPPALGFGFLCSWLMFRRVYYCFS